MAAAYRDGERPRASLAGCGVRWPHAFAPASRTGVLIPQQCCNMSRVLSALRPAFLRPTGDLRCAHMHVDRTRLCQREGRKRRLQLGGSNGPMSLSSP